MLQVIGSTTWSYAQKSLVRMLIRFLGRLLLRFWLLFRLGRAGLWCGPGLGCRAFLRCRTSLLLWSLLRRSLLLRGPSRGWSWPRCWLCWLRPCLRPLGWLRRRSGLGRRRPCLRLRLRSSFWSSFWARRLGLWTGGLWLPCFRLTRCWLSRARFYIGLIRPVRLIDRPRALPVRRSLRRVRPLCLARSLWPRSVRQGRCLLSGRHRNWTHHWRRLDVVICLDRLRCNKFRWSPPVYRRKLRPVRRCCLGQLQLCGHRRRMWCTICRYLRRQRPSANTLWAAVVADVVVVNDRRIVDHNLALVHIGDVDISNVVDRSVVIELIIVPVTALIAAAHISKAVIHTAIEADIATPIAMIESVTAVEESPIAGRPQSPLIRRLRPCAWNPVISLI